MAISHTNEFDFLIQAQLTESEKLYRVTNTLDRVTPQIMDKYYSLCDIHDMYATTITFNPNYTFKVSDIGEGILFKLNKNRKIKDLSAYKQFLLSHQMIRRRFEGFKYIACFEFQKNGIIHWHMALTHDIGGSILNQSIRKLTKRYGKANTYNDACNIVSDPKAWLTYITKEDTGAILSSHYTARPDNKA
jgi:hypothetical protein